MYNNVCLQCSTVHKSSFHCNVLNCMYKERPNLFHLRAVVIGYSKTVEQHFLTTGIGVMNMTSEPNVTFDTLACLHHQM